MENSLNDPFGIDELQRRKQAVLDQASEKARIRQHKKGRLTARERIQQLLDPDSFVERGMLAHSDLKAAREKSPADGKVCGQGSIEGKAVCVSADDVSVMAGAGGRVGYKKEYELQLYAQQRGLPYIHMGDGGGARIPDIMGATGMMTFTVPVNHAARNRGNFMATVIMGECYGGPTWKACQSDIVIQVKGTSMAVSGPPVLAAATKEQVSPEELGGWEVHAKTTGLVDLFAENDQHALEIIPQLLSYFPPNAAELPPIAPAREPATEEGDILELVPQDARKTYSMHKVLKTLVDADSLLELKPYFDGSLITALARLDGKVVGILANNPKVMAGAM
ncbi:MAG: carboxyl transferase domain-containing protein [Bacteroidota bacterium]